MAFWIAISATRGICTGSASDALIGANIFVDTLQVDCLKEFRFALRMRQLSGKCDHAGEAFVLGVEESR